MKSPILGVTKQMLWEHQCIEAVGLPWVTKVFTANSDALPSALVACAGTGRVGGGARLLPPVQRWIALRRGYYRWLVSVQSEFDVILLRYASYDPFQLAFLRRAKRPVFLIHHTLELPELALEGGWTGMAKVLAERLVARSTQRAAGGLIGVTYEILAYESARCGRDVRSGYVYPNGAMYTGSQYVADRRSDKPHVLFVASHFAAWHGLDLVLASAVRSRLDFVLDIVGGVPEDLERFCARDSRIVIHGALNSNQVRGLAEHADVGLSSFALFRAGMQEACTLKVRECLAMGLPVYAGYDEALPESFPYYRKGPCNIDDILAFGIRMRQIGRREVAEAARPYIDKAVLMRGLYEWLSSRIGPAPLKAQNGAGRPGVAISTY